MEDQTFADFGVVDLEDLFDVFGEGVLVQLAAVCVFGLVVEEVNAKIGEYLLELGGLVLPLSLSLIAGVVRWKRGNTSIFVFEGAFSHG